MARDASGLLGAPAVAGVTVNPRGYGWKAGTAGLGPAGAAIARAAGARADTSGTPVFPRMAFLAVTDSEVALIRIGSGGVNGRLEEVIARVPRGEVASANVSRGVLRCGVTVSFTDGGSWELEVSSLIRHQAARVIHALGF